LVERLFPFFQILLKVVSQPYLPLHPTRTKDTAMPLGANAANQVGYYVGAAEIWW
jgi:hypothetical protein